jgi:hypothetical protein
MKAKTLVACALTAAALPLAPALAQNAEPSGPQGTGWYGARNAAVPTPQAVQPADAYTTPRRVPQDTRRSTRQRGSYDGPSWETNPPAPAQ